MATWRARGDLLFWGWTDCIAWQAQGLPEGSSFSAVDEGLVVDGAGGDDGAVELDVFGDVELGDDPEREVVG